MTITNLTVKKFDRIYIEITNICNFACPFCSKTKRPKQEMTTDEFEAVIKQAKLFTSEVCLHVLGEPLLHRDFEKILNICKENQIKINLVTNGFFIRDRFNMITNFQTTFAKINFSLHSYLYQPLHMETKFNEILSAADALSQNGVQIELRNLQHNDDKLFENKLQASLNKVLYQSLTSIHNNQKLKSRLYYVVKKPFDWPDKTANNPIAPQHSGRIYCMAGRTHVAVLSNLDVVPCCLDSSAQICLGNLKNNSLSQILASDRFNKLYNAFASNNPSETLCKTCTYNFSVKEQNRQV